MPGHWLNTLFQLLPVRARQRTITRKSPPRFRWHRPCVEVLENRLAPAVTNLLIDPGIDNAGAVAELILRIGEANASPENDTINLFAGGTYTLTAMHNLTNGANGLPEIRAAGGALTIAGGIGGATIARDTTLGTPEFRYFLVNGGNLTLNDLTLTKGVGTAEGGAIRLQSGTLALNNVTVSGNSTDGTAPFAGGGIFVNSGTANITDSLISVNTSGSTDGLSGGGMGIAGGTVTITNTTISGNLSKGTGGGISIFGGSLTITNSSISNNTALRDGGGIFKFGAALTINDSSISNNKGLQGGGLGINTGLVTISNSTISSNEATGANGGGGLFFQNAATLVISNSLVTGNTASNGTGGGGIRLNGSSRATITHTTISNNAATGQGGGLHINTSGTVNINNSTISGNSARADGGGISAGGNSFTVTTINNSTIANNRADFDNSGGVGELGGGINVAAGTVTLISTIVAGNFLGTGTTADDIDRSAGTLHASNSLIQTGSVAINGTNSNNIFNQDPLLAPLADNGGPTETHALLPGSPAIDTGSNPLSLTNDQRGFSRQIGAAADIGAYEADPTVPHVIDRGSIIPVSQVDEPTPPPPIEPLPVGGNDTLPGTPPPTTGGSDGESPGDTGESSTGSGGSDPATEPVGDNAPEAVPEPAEAIPVKPRVEATTEPRGGTSTTAKPTNPVNQRATAQAGPRVDFSFLRQELDDQGGGGGGGMNGANGVTEVATGVTGATLVLTVGYIALFGRNAILVWTAMINLPMWRELDPLAVLEFWEKKGRGARAEQEVGELFDA